MSFLGRFKVPHPDGRPFRMIDVLHELLPTVMKRITNAIEGSNLEDWDRLAITKRKPHAYRVSTMINDLRVCLHRFVPCRPEDCFTHPHPWPVAFLLLEGEYAHTIGYSPDLETEPHMLYREILRPYSVYEIVDRQTWHSVQPTKRTFTIMVNGEEWYGHKHTRRTIGKDLLIMPSTVIYSHVQPFRTLIKDYNESKGRDSETTEETEGRNTAS